MKTTCGGENGSKRNEPLSPSPSVSADVQCSTAGRGGVPIRGGEMGFTKLDEGILQSSIMADSSDNFKIWIALLACCKADGLARIAETYLAGVCHLPLERVLKAFKKFQGPDPLSRNQDNEGRRIERVPHGWKILNYDYYRKLLYSDNPAAVRQRRHREKDAVRLVLDDGAKRWEGITPELKALWAKSYPGCDVETVLQEMIAFWDAQPAAKRKLNWKRTIVNRLKWLQDHGGTPGHTTKGPVSGTWLKMMKEREARGEKI